MKLVIGLGNPGASYRGTRHNVGFDVVDALAGRHALSFETAPIGANTLMAKWRRADDTVLVAKPLTFMNLSGEAAGSLCRYFKIEIADVLIVCDDVNLPLGRLRARATGTEGGHNGLKSIAQHFLTIDYARLRIGVGRGDTRRDLADHVLARFEPDERPGVDNAIARAADAVESWLDAGLERMMNLFNRVEDTA